METNLINTLDSWLNSTGMNAQIADVLKFVILVLAIAVLSYIVNLIAKTILLRVLRAFTRKTKTFWDDILYERKVFNQLSHIAPALVIYMLAPAALKEFPDWLTIIQAGTSIYMLIVILFVVNAFLNALNAIYQNYEISKVKSIKGYIQVVKIITWIVISILIIATLIGKSPLLLFTGLGAFAAVLLLIFKDTILGLVGSIQLSANDMIRPGDWISMPNFGADGTVTDIGLTTVKVQNWDMTITTIPTYALVANSFQNWRGMENSGGRRISRSIRIDMNSVKFCSEEMLEKFGKIQLISDYIEKKQKELSEYNKERGIDESIVVNGRRQTNLGVFRKYLEQYLRNNPNINQDMTFLIRHLEPTEIGIPMQIYVFSKVQAWVQYEGIQSDIFDHILATIPHFELKVFQNPSGADFKDAFKH